MRALVRNLVRGRALSPCGAAALLLCAVAVCSCRPGGTAGRTPAFADPVAAEHLSLRSVHTGGDYELWVAVPRTYRDTMRRYPVVYVLDGNALFGLASDVVRLLTLDRRFPEVIVVGIGYPTTEPMSVLQRRLADFTPTNVPQEDTLHGVHTTPRAQRSGNGPAFMQTLVAEILPTVEQRYRVDSTRRTLWGYSLGGLFALHVMLERPRAFDAYLVTSPSLWWDDAWYFRRMDESGRDNAPSPARVFISAGRLEEQADPWAKMVTNVERVAAVLRRQGERGLRVHAVVFPDETHLSVPAASFSRGLRTLLAPDSAKR